MSIEADHMENRLKMKLPTILFIKNQEGKLNVNPGILVLVLVIYDMHIPFNDQ